MATEPEPQPSSVSMKPLRRPFVFENAEVNLPFSFEQRLSSSARDTIDWAANLSYVSGSILSNTAGLSGSTNPGTGKANTSPTTPHEVLPPPSPRGVDNSSSDSPPTMGAGGTSGGGTTLPHHLSTTRWRWGSGLTMGSDGIIKLLDFPEASLTLGWGGSIQSFAWPPMVRPSYRFLLGGKAGPPGTVEASSMVTLERNFKPCSLDVAISSPQVLGTYSHIRVDPDLIHGSLFWTPSWARVQKKKRPESDDDGCQQQDGGTSGLVKASGESNSSRTSTTTADPHDDSDFVPTSRWGLGLTLKRDMASGVNLLLGHARDIGAYSHFTAHTDVLRRCCATLRTNFMDQNALSVAARLRVNLITLHDTVLDVGVSYRAHDKVRLRASSTAIGHSIGICVSDVPSTLQEDCAVSKWVPGWIRGARWLQVGNFDATCGLTWSHRCMMVGGGGRGSGDGSFGSVDPSFSRQVNLFVAVSAR